MICCFFNDNQMIKRESINHSASETIETSISNIVSRHILHFVLSFDARISQRSLIRRARRTLIRPHKNSIWRHLKSNFARSLILWNYLVRNYKIKSNYCCRNGPRKKFQCWGNFRVYNLQAAQPAIPRWTLMPTTKNLLISPHSPGALHDLLPFWHINNKYLWLIRKNKKLRKTSWKYLLSQRVR